MVAAVIQIEGVKDCVVAAKQNLYNEEYYRDVSHNPTVAHKKLIDRTIHWFKRKEF